MIDTHAHIYLEAFDKDIEAVIHRAKNNGIEKILLPAIDLPTIERMIDLEASYPNLCHAMIGLHPCSVTANPKDSLHKIFKLTEKKKFIAIGEIGLDFLENKHLINEQMFAFDFQCKMAMQLKLPIVIHSRNSLDKTIAIAKKYAIQGVKGVFHCFTGNVEQAKTIRDIGFYMGIGGIATFKNAHLDPVIQAVGLQGILLETDSPYLAPTPYRGKRNEPSFLIEISKKIATCLNTSIQKVEQITNENTNSLFDL